MGGGCHYYHPLVVGSFLPTRGLFLHPLQARPGCAEMQVELASAALGWKHFPDASTPQALLFSSFFSRFSRVLVPKPQGLVTFQMVEAPSALPLSEEGVKQNIFLANNRHVMERRNKPSVCKPRRLGSCMLS